MRWSRVREIFRKDFEELRGNRTVFLSLFALPALLLFEGIAFTLGRAASLSPGTPGAGASLLQGSALSLDLLLLVPPLTAITIGSTSIVQEKTTRTLEPLLATPISDRELLLGKSLTPLVPGVVAVWACYAVLFGVVDAVGWHLTQTLLLPTPSALFQMLVEAPLLGIVGTFSILAISSWAKDARAAQQIGTVVVLPILVGILLFFLVFPSPEGEAAFTVLLALAAYLLLRVALRKFDRPSILVSWR
ncbi:MAG: ABC transporter permease subunit [Thermoplasmata archaeon]